LITKYHLGGDVYNNTSPEPVLHSGKPSGSKHGNWTQANWPFPFYMEALQLFLLHPEAFACQDLNLQQATTGVNQTK
jgi:hypothetical protein